MSTNIQKIVFGVYKEASGIIILGSCPNGIIVDLDSGYWWQVKWNAGRNDKTPDWRGKTKIGKNRIFRVKNMPNQVWGVYDVMDIEQLNALVRDSIEALK